MNDMADLMKLFDAVHGEIVIADENIDIVYMNREAVNNYDKYGGAALVGRSLLGCHNENSRRVIRDLYARWRRGEREVYQYLTRQKSRRVIITPIIEDGELLGCLQFVVDEQEAVQV